MSDTRIEWANKSWSPITGCSPASEGCMNCWAKRMALRLRGRCGYPLDDPFAVTFHPDRLDEPLHWKKPARIFVCSMSDLFHPNVQSQWRAAIWKTIRSCPQHTFIVLTKRPGALQRIIADARPRWQTIGHVWLGVSVENQARADERAPILLQIPAAKYIVSIEPMLWPIELPGEWLSPLPRCSGCGREGSWNSLGHNHEILHDISDRFPELCGIFEQTPGLDWVIVGCESGPNRRPCKLTWIADVVKQCRAAGVPCFVKQIPLPLHMGGLYTAGGSIELWDETISKEGRWRVSHDMNEWPEPLRVRDFP